MRFNSSNVDRTLMDSKYLIEGLDFDISTKTIKINLDNEDGINSNSVINPTYSEVNGMEVISIFKRKLFSNSIQDGNPLLNALKGIFGWKISQTDIVKLLKQFIKITNKIKPKYDTIVLVPSSNPLNTKLLHRLNGIIKSDDTICEVFINMPIDVVFNSIDFSKLSQDMGSRLDMAFFNMGDTFQYKYLSSDLRKIMSNVWDNLNCQEINMFADKVNDKNILILDDTISSGATISYFADSIREVFDPKSITIITLFPKVV